jgi:hypothetical protein
MQMRIKRKNRCSKFDARVQESELAENCEKCIKVNGKCLIIQNETTELSGGFMPESGAGNTGEQHI